MKIVNVGYRENVCEGASSGPLVVRSSDPLPRNIDPSAPIIVPRRTRIPPKDLKDHGFIIGCQGCKSVEMGHLQRKSHSEECRKRIEAAMEESEAGKDRLQRTK